MSKPAVSPKQFSSFGSLLKYLRRREELTQREFAIQVGYSDTQISRLEQNQRVPDAATLTALFVPALHLEHEADWVARLLELARQARLGEVPETETTETLTPKNNLPALLTSFVGREKEQDEIVSLLSKNRLVTLAGMGGIGKTRLAMQVGQKLLNDYPNGVWFIPLDSLSDPALIPQTVAAVFDIRERSSDQPLLERLTFSMRAKTILLIFDNCEHLLEACAQLITVLLTNCPNLKVLTTSRETLNIQGEAVYSMPSLAIPEHDTTINEFTEYESIQLFTQRATLASTSFMLTKENASTVVEICYRVDGIPLAIELAAAHVNILSVEEILRQLHDSFSLLTGGSRTALPRHQSLRASIDWSWGLLSEAEQIFLRQLSVFAGGWTLETPQAVCDGDIMDLTSALVQKSLIMVNPESGRDTRYRFHETIHRYAHQKLTEAGDEANIRTRHLKYFLGVSELAEPALRGPAQVEWMARLKDERDNFRTALVWADKNDVEAGLYISSRLGRLWEYHDIREGNYWLSTFLQKPESRAYPRARAMALFAHLPFLNHLNRVDTWKSTAKECLELYRALGDKYIEADILLMSTDRTSDATQRKELFQQVIQLAQASGDIWMQARTLRQAGWNSSGDERVAYWEQALTLFRQSGDWLSLGACLYQTGNFALLQGNVELAEKCLAEATFLNEELQDKESQAGILHVRAQIALVRGDYNQSHVYLQQELGILEEFGTYMQSLWSRSHLGYLALREGNLAEAHDIFTQNVQEFFEDKIEIGIVFNLEGVAGLFVAMGKPESAARVLGWADATRKRINDTRPRLEQADVDKIIAACLAKMGEAAFAEAYEEGQKMTMEKAVELAVRK